MKKQGRQVSMLPLKRILISEVIFLLRITLGYLEVRRGLQGQLMGQAPSDLGSLTHRELSTGVRCGCKDLGGRLGTCLKIIALGGTGEQAKAGTPSVS